MRTPITYYGGKQGMADQIISMIPRHRIYCEPFFGGGAVFFAKGKSELEVVNDNNEMLINFYKICREDFGELQGMVYNTLHSELVFLKARDIFRKRVESTDVEKAWSMWVLSNECHAGSLYGGWKYCNGTAGTHFGKVLRMKREEFTSKLYDRLCEVQISCRDALKVINNRDSTDTFFLSRPTLSGSVSRSLLWLLGGRSAETYRASVFHKREVNSLKLLDRHTQSCSGKVQMELQRSERYNTYGRKHGSTKKYRSPDL